MVVLKNIHMKEILQVTRPFDCLHQSHIDKVDQITHDSRLFLFIFVGFVYFFLLLKLPVLVINNNKESKQNHKK